VLDESGLGPKTRWNVLACFQAFMKWLVKRGNLAQLPEFPRLKADEHEWITERTGTTDRRAAEAFGVRNLRGRC